ncbi:MAG: DUF4058 family protein [Planctomycetes bacterium]|nr:DUF4058 family protein [Planctomycetota bacterium]
MVGPFPGMDPYLERRGWWGQIHSRLIHALAEQLGAGLPGYLVDVEQDMLLIDQATGEPLAVAIPDVALAPRSSRDPGVQLSAPSATHAPVSLEVILPPAELLERRHYYLVLREQASARPVTVLEVLSYSNKDAGPLKRERFRLKREMVLRSATHWIEVDLLRAGTREVGELFQDRLAPSDYLVLVSRGTRVGRRHEAYPFSLRDPIPRIGIPLSSPDPDFECDLGAALSRVYESFGGRDRISYAEEPAPPLLPADRQWADRLLRDAGRRT